VTKRAVLNKVHGSLMYALKADVNEQLPMAAIPPLMVERLPVEAALFHLPGPSITVIRLRKIT